MENDALEMIEGYFAHTLFKSDKYMVSKFKTDDGTITVTGPSFDYEKNQKYVLTGNYVDHPRYGFQFNMLTIEKYLSTRKEEIISFLSGKTFKGIGKKAAEKIYDHFGDETLLVLKEDPSRASDIGLNDKQILAIEMGFASLSDPENEILFYLVSHGFTNQEAQKIFNTFKLATIEKGNDNPFSYYNDVYGMSFDKVSGFASKIDFEDRESKYCEAFLIHLLKEYTFNTGDMFIRYDELLNIISKYGYMKNFEEVLSLAIEHNYIYQEDDRLYLFEDYNDELYIANYLKSFKKGLILDDELIEEGIENCQKDLCIEYDKNQKNAISSFFRNDISIIVGGPGTGKTTIVKSMSRIFKDSFPYNNMIIVAPTGRAAKRINEICNVEAKTIHSLLRWNLETNTFVFNADNPILYDALIIDEFSMVDTNLFACLLKACSRVKKICIIGDENQLPSIKPGYVLKDLIESEIFNVTRLTANYRQRKGNDIIELSNDIISNDVDFSRYKNDISFLNVKERNIDLISMIKMDMENGYGLDDIQVLSPMYKGEFGIDNLNLLMQKAFNPPDSDKKEKSYGKYVFREYDKILQLKNRPNDDVYNGDIGILEDVDLKEKSLIVNFQNTYVFYNYEDLEDISLAYAMSVHKAQGSEYPIVYFIISRNNIHMLNRNLIYTAISRAKVKLSIIGEESLFMEGLHRLMKRRNTTLKNRLLN